MFIVTNPPGVATRRIVAVTHSLAESLHHFQSGMQLWYNPQEGGGRLYLMLS
jgi:hypothetical protein